MILFTESELVRLHEVLDGLLKLYADESAAHARGYHEAASEMRERIDALEKVKDELMSWDTQGST